MTNFISDSCEIINLSTCFCSCESEVHIIAMSQPEGNIQENNEYIYIGDVTVCSSNRSNRNKLPQQINGKSILHGNL